MSDITATFREFTDKGAKGKDGKFDEMTNKACTRMFTDSKILTKKACTSQNLDIAFSAVKPKGKLTITVAEMDALIGRIAESYGKDNKCTKEEAPAKIKAALAASKKESHGTTGVSKTGNVDGMTDASKYTGSHKERFDADGKGKGMDGRADVVENTGYVGNYKGKDTYDKK